jgi:uncharacterized protein with FMN-binding domain
MARKMPRQLVALSSSAIAAIYFAGLVATRGADASIASAEAAEAAPSAIVGAAAAVANTPTPVVSATATATVAATATQSQSSGYNDGTYSGTGTSRRGNVSVSVTVQSGRIATVTISNITTQYPVSRIASLPAQVVSRQSSQVDNVSGATYSAQAFSTAVQAALAKALA